MPKLKKIFYRLILICSILIIFAIIVYAVMHAIGKRNIQEDITTDIVISTEQIISTESGEEAEEAAYEHITYQGQEYEYRDNLINILCLGIDKDEEMSLRDDNGNSVGQSDAIFLVSLDLENNDIRIIAIPRDTMVTLQKFDGNGSYLGSGPGQLTLQYAYADGQEKSAKLVASQVSLILGDIPINAYVAINLRCLWVLNDAIGGVDITMDDDYTLLNPEFKKGVTVHLSANSVENYVRGRDTSVAGSAYTRIHRQKIYMQAFFEKAKTVFKEDMTLPVTLMQTLEKDMETDITVDEAVYLLSEALDCSFLEENMCTLPGEIQRGEKYEEYYLDEDAVEALVVELFYEVD